MEALRTMNTSACPIRILLVDDDQKFADTARFKLGTAGLRTALENATSLDNALARLDKKRFDIVVLNPYFGGIQDDAAYLTIRKHSCSLPMLLMVSAQHEASAVRLLDLGADDYVIKEMTKPTLLWHTARSIVQRSVLRERLRILETIAGQSIDGPVINRVKEVAQVDSQNLYKNPSFDRLKELKVATLENVEKTFKHFADSNKEAQICLDQLFPVEKQRDFTAALAHDFKAPLASAMLASDLLKDERLGPLTTEQSDVVRQLHSNNQQLLRLATNMVELYDKQERDISPSPIPFNLKQFLADCIFDLAPLARANGVRLVAHVAVKFEEYYADQDAVKLILANLINNAITFSPRGGTVSLFARTIGREIVIRINDEGPPLTKDEQRHIFDNLWPADKTSQRYTAATALAFHVSGKIVRAYNGAIRCVNSSATETIWEVALPLVHRLDD